MRPFTPRARARVAGLGLALLAGALPGVAGASGPASLSVLQAPADATDVVRSPGSIGGLRLYKAPITFADGRAGMLYGMNGAAAGPEGDDPFTKRVGWTVIDLGGGDTVVIAGLLFVTDTPPPAGIFVDRPIVGGTGLYAGVRGVVRSTVTEDGSWQQEMQLAGAGDPVAETLELALGAPVVELVETGETGTSRGDLGVSATDVTLPDGAAGSLRGTATVVGLPLAAGDPTVTAISVSALDLGARGTLFLAGLTRGPADGSSLPGRPVSVAIIGGIGGFAGARGQADLIRAADGTGTLLVTRIAVPGEAPGTGAPSLVLGATSIASDAFGAGDPIGSSPGDTWARHCSVTDADGADAGASYGYLTVVDTTVTVRGLGLTLVDVAGSGTIATIGYLDDLPGTTGRGEGALPAAAVIGGTGAYAGVAGEVTNQPLTDELVQRTFTFGALGGA